MTDHDQSGRCCRPFLGAPTDRRIVISSQNGKMCGFRAQLREAFQEAHAIACVCEDDRRNVARGRQFSAPSPKPIDGSGITSGRQSAFRVSRLERSFAHTDRYSGNNRSKRPPGTLKRCAGLFISRQLRGLIASPPDSLAESTYWTTD